MKPRRLPSGAWNVRITVNKQTYSFTDPDKKTVMRSPTRSTQWRSRPFQRSKIRSNISYHSNNKSPAERQIQRLAGYFICRQRGSNPHMIGLVACFVGIRSKLRSNSKVVKYYHV